MSLPLVVVRTGTSNAASIFACLRRAGFAPEWATEPKQVDSVSQVERHTSHISQVEAAPFVMVPGVGTFGDALAGIRSGGMEEVLKERVRNLRPTFFICVGIQLLARSSEESPGVTGLCLLDTDVVRLPSTVLVPQHGWNEVLPCSLLQQQLLHSCASERVVVHQHHAWLHILQCHRAGPCVCHSVPPRIVIRIRP